MKKISSLGFEIEKIKIINFSQVGWKFPIRIWTLYFPRRGSIFQELMNDDEILEDEDFETEANNKIWGRL
jgi:hypothetical protein